MQKSYTERYVLNPREFETIQNFGVSNPLQRANHRFYRRYTEMFGLYVPEGYCNEPVRTFSQNSFRRFWQEMDSLFFGVDYQEPEEH
jgi:hypothetical protein